jgi:putative phosphoribosyl transferase
MFRDRTDAGQHLAKRLIGYGNRDDVIVVGLPRGGVPVASEIAQQLHAPLNILLVRKVGAPGQAELAMGAIAPGGIRILDHQLIRDLNIGEQELASIIAKEEGELLRREQFYKNVRGAIEIKDRRVIVVDDGIATGSSMLAAIRVLRSQAPARIIVATPVAPPHAEREIKRVVDEFVCVHVSEYFPAVGFFYRDFSQVEDEEVRDLLLRSTRLMKPNS